ncbi:hypothetical protein [Butyrivibrio sp. AC2005]|uniref:hypothetical protein n=1 Tax=Butyrivibrio sp. AC2005 TaxID=1280672 RepID=UPI00040E8445|nr:hypothetical protein [Butyrivibrio sp. AC2005]
MKKVAIAEYINLENENKEPVGHAPKVLEESADLLKNKYNITLFCSESLSGGLITGYEVIKVKGNFHKGNKALMLISRWKNLNKVFSFAKDYDIIWFTNVDWVMYLYLAMKRKKRPHIMVTLYRDIIDDMKTYSSSLRRLLGRICMRAVDDVALYIVTNPSLKLFDNQITLPDFYYSEKYEKYKDVKKKEQLVCLGAMRGTKDLEGVVRHFAGTEIKVYIAGDFMDKDEYKSLKDISEDNITIEDRVLPFDEYYSLIAESKYTLLPYKKERYENATSGILLESIFLNSIPIAPEWLLSNNKISGIGYSSISELPITMEGLNKLAENYNPDVEAFRKENIQDRLVKAIEVYIQ